MKRSKSENEKIFGGKIEEIKYKKRSGVYVVTFNEHVNISIIKTPRGSGGSIEAAESQEACIARELDS